jgi:hypothetical protein
VPGEYVKLAVVVAADGAVVDATYADSEVAAIKVQPFGSGAYDVAFVTTAEASEARSMTLVSSEEGDASVTGLYCNFSVNFDARRFTHQVTVRVQTTRDQKRADCAFRLDLQLA